MAPTPSASSPAPATPNATAPRTIVHLLRHGEVHNPTKVLYGRISGFELSDLGHEMAATVAGSLGGEGTDAARRDIVKIVASPLVRAQQTAGPSARVFDLPIDTDERVIEAENHFEGLRVGHGRGSLANPEHWPFMVAPWRPSWGESHRSIVWRMTRAIHEVRADAEGHEALIVSHQLPVWITRLSGEGHRLWHDPRSRQCNLASLTSFTFAGPHLVDIGYSEPAHHLSEIAQPGAGA